MTSKDCDSRTQSRKSANRAGMFAALLIAHTRRSRDRRKYHVPAANTAGALRIAGDQIDLRRDRRERLRDQATIEMDHVARFVNVRAGRGECSPPAWRQDAHALVLEHPERGQMQALNLVVRKYSN